MKRMLMAATMLLAMGLGVAHADTITIDTIEDGFENAQNGSNVSIVNQANPAPDTISWGTNIGNGQSSYVWNSRDVSFDVETENTFSLGTFTHNNRTIGSGSSITSVDLAFEVGTFTNPATLSATFNFAHNETPNSTPCAPGSVSVCDDYVTISNAFFNEQIQYGGKTYFFTLLGFSTNGGVATTNVFQTQESVANNADLYAIITAAPVPDGGATLALLGGALVGLGALRRRFGI